MAVECALAGAVVSITDNSQMIQTRNRGMVQADQLVQGDVIRFIADHDCAEIVSPPVVS